MVGCGVEPEMHIQDENAIYVQADLTDAAQACRVVEEAVKAFGRVNKLVCCAGVTFIGSLETTDYDKFMRELSINLGGVFNMCKAAVVELKKQEGSTIVTVGSDLGVRPIPERIGYCPSKAGVIMLTKCIALEFAPHIRANAILPGLVRTPMIEQRFWEAYKHWQAATLNKKLLILELGEGFKYPTVMRWPFEKVAFFNQKACLYRVNRHLSQVPEELGERAVGVDGDPVEFVAGMV